MPLESPMITLHPSNRQFHCLPGRSILASGLSAGLALPFSCSNGRCGECRAKVLRGEVRQLSHQDYVLSQAEKAAGTCLMCCCTCSTDTLLEVIEASSVEDIPEQTLKAKRCRLEVLDDITIVGFKFVRGKAFRFLPGQRVHVEFPSGLSAEIAIASCPCNAQFVEFHLPATSARVQCNELVQALTALDRVTLTGPLGSFTLSKHVEIPKLFIAVGDGFASVQGLIEHQFNLELKTPSTLLWLNSPTVAHYRHNLCRSWADAIDEFFYIPAQYDSDWLVNLEHFLQTYNDKHETYLSGPQQEIDKIHCKLIQAGCNKNTFYINT